MESGETLEADIIILATGLKMVLLADVPFTRDGEAIDFAKTFTYKGMMFSGVPNLVSTFGYINASWTLRADLIASWVCRLLNHMRATEMAVATPRISEHLAASMPSRFWIDDFSAGYIKRSMNNFPKQGDKMPWINPQNFRQDRKMLRHDPIEDGFLILEPARSFTESDLLLEIN